MVKEKLRKALEDAVGYYNNGLTANEAVVKSASDHDLTIDQTDRVVESFNTAKTINYFDKNASDRTGKFDLASKKDVTLALFGDSTAEKSASSIPAYANSDSTFYAMSPDKTANRKHVFAEKKAAMLDLMSKVAEERWAHEYSDNTIQGMASDAYATIKAAEADITSAIGTIDNYLFDATEKIAKAISRGPYDIPEDRANLFKVACPHKLVIREVSKFSTLLKNASGGCYAKMSVVDTEPIDDLLKEADDIMEAVNQRSIYRKKKAEFHEKALRIKAAMLKDPSLSGKVTKCAEDYIHRPATNKQAAMSKIIDGGNSGKILSAVSAQKSRKDENEHLRDEARGAILADLLSSDPILQDADPRQVSAIYKSIISSSPRVSLNKEVVRSVLRGAVNSIAISPNDVKVLTDVDKGINTAYTSDKYKQED